jgi:DNA-binding transcriptional MerR regulator
MHQIGEVAELAKVSTRLLRHYDEIGLLVPSGRSEAGYRLYSHADLERLQSILFYRALEFPLDAIRRLMKGPGFDRHAALLHQRELLQQQAARLGDLLALIDKTLGDIDPETGREKHPMNTKEMFEVFPDMKQEHQDEAQERWGNTEAWKQSAERWSRYTKADVERMKLEMTQVYGRLENVFASGARPDAPEALTAIEAMRLWSDKWFYDTSKEMHVKGTEFVSRDERFVRNIDKNCPGLAAWIHQATKANLAAG